jgi:hypothetical protein
MDEQVFGVDLPQPVPPQHDDDQFNGVMDDLIGDLSADLSKYGTLAAAAAGEIAADVKAAKQTPEQKKAADDAAKAKAAGADAGAKKSAGMSTGAKVAIGGSVAAVFAGVLFLALRKKGRR